MAYIIRLTRAAEREFKKLAKRNRAVASDLLAAIYELEKDPRPTGHKKLSGEEDLYRIRLGEYRVVYQIDGAELIVLVVRIGHRREVYKAKF